jgi:penicillin amidase
VSQRHLLEAFTSGVNAWITSGAPPAFEYSVLDCPVVPWQPSDCMLVMLGLFDSLCGDIASKRSVSVIEECLPGPLARFLTCDEDLFSIPLCGSPIGRRPQGPLPSLQLQQLAACANADPYAPGSSLELPETALGSNSWVVRGDDGKRALLANDMHMPLSVPSLAYWVAYDYGAGPISGFTVPGFPAIVSGSNQRVTWGITNFCGDNVDVIRLGETDSDVDIHPTAAGLRRFARRIERVFLRGAAHVDVEVLETCWGPVAEEKLLGERVAYRWAALDPDATNFEFADIEAASSVEELLSRARGSGCPPLNIVAADVHGSIGWTVTGRFPLRAADGSHSARMAVELEPGPCSYVPREELPLIVNPHCGFIVTANNRTVGSGDQHDLGRNFACGIRASRIAELLKLQSDAVSAAAAVALQLDVHAGFYEFYRTLIESAIAQTGERSEWSVDVTNCINLRSRLADSIGTIAFLGRVRDCLARSLLAAYCRPCLEAEPAFAFSWTNCEGALRAILLSQEPGTFPFHGHFAGWPAYLADAARRCRDHVLAATHRPSLGTVRLRDLSPSRITHPLSTFYPDLAKLLDMPPTRQPGGCFAVRVATPSHGAVTRLVSALGESLSVQSPGGQSGNPLSPHYRDQHNAWLNGIPARIVESSFGVWHGQLRARPICTS